MLRKYSRDKSEFRFNEFIVILRKEIEMIFPFFSKKMDTYRISELK